MQDSETIELLGIDLKSLARKAFPELRGGKEFDHLLKGRFFQALIPKWQWKLGAPKPEETFPELYDRARMLEKHELQNVASAAGRKTTTPNDKKGRQNKSQQGKNKFQRTNRVPTQSAASKEDSGRADTAESNWQQEVMLCVQEPFTLG